MTRRRRSNAGCCTRAAHEVAEANVRGSAPTREWFDVVRERLEQCGLVAHLSDPCLSMSHDKHWELQCMIPMNNEDLLITGCSKKFADVENLATAAHR